MYAWLWRHLPGPVPVRALIALTLAGAAAVVCFEWVFPAVSPLLPFEDALVGAP